jgi:hypothetical protein
MTQGPSFTQKTIKQDIWASGKGYYRYDEMEGKKR